MEVFLWLVAFVGAGGFVSFVLWFWQRPHLSIELDEDLEGGPPKTLGCFLFNQPITQKLACNLGIQRKDAVITFASFRVSNVDIIGNNEIVWEVVQSGLPPLSIHVSYQSHYSPIVAIHPDDGRVRIVKSGLQLPPLNEGKYLAVVQLEMDGRLQHCSRFFQVTSWAPFVYWVGPTIRAGPEIPKFAQS